MNQLSRKQRATALCVALLMGCSSCARRGSPATSGIKTNLPFANIGQPVLISKGDVDAAEPAMAAGSDGTAYIVWVEHRANKQADVWLSRFDHTGQPKGAPVRINPNSGEATAWRGDPPTVAVSPDNSVYVGWTARVGTENGSAANLYLSSSRDGGQTFAAPTKVNDDQKPGAHGMHSLAIGKDGRVYLGWLDERNLTPVPMKDMKMSTNSGGHHMESNRELFLTFSTDGGRTFAPNQKIATDVCPCCKTALAIAPDGRLYASWRQVLPGDFRHIAVSSSTNGGETFTKPVIVSDDKWMLHGCPVSGASLEVGGDGVLHVVWYSAGQQGQPGLYRSESLDGGRTFTARELLATGQTRGTPVMLHAEQLFLSIWEENDGGAQRVMTSKLNDGNKAATGLLVAENGSQPAAVSTGQQIYIAYISKVGERQSIWLAIAQAD